MEHLLALDGHAARDPLVAGSKAARLALARAAGLPVLPGWILPSEASAKPILLGAEALERSGHASARLAVANLALDTPVREELRRAAEGFGGAVVVRSSVAQDVDPRWSGAFATYLDVRPDEMPAAIGGCWASAFSRDVVARCGAIGVRVRDLRIAVLIQRRLEVEAGGTASTDADGRVTISAAVGEPAGLVSGRRAGALAEVLPDGTRVPERDLDGLDGGMLAEVASLARAVRAATGDDAIEWGATSDGVVVLQARSSPALPPSRLARRPARALPAGAVRVAWLAHRYPAPLGDELVLPWALGAGDVPQAGPIRGADPQHSLTEVRAVAKTLSSRAWGLPPERAAREAAGAVRMILGSAPEDGFARLRAMRPVDPALAARLLGLMAGIAEELVAREVIPHPDLVWRLSWEELDRAVRNGVRPPLRRGPDRWEPFVFEVVRSVGDVHLGSPAAPGIGAGPVRVIGGPLDATRRGPHGVLVARFPAPQLAPLMWGCAGLVTATGSAGAHVFEVARSVGVPAVAGVDLARELRPGSKALAAVDGDHGSVCVLHESPSDATRSEEDVSPPAERAGGFMHRGWR